MQNRVNEKISRFEEIMEAIKQTSNWKSPGLDMLHN